MFDDRKEAAEMSEVEPDWRGFTVEERLEKPGGGDGVQLAFLAGAGEFFAGALAGVELLLGLKRAEALIDVENFDASADREMPAPVDRFLRGGADRAVHVQGEADDHSFDP